MSEEDTRKFLMSIDPALIEAAIKQKKVKIMVDIARYEIVFLRLQPM